MRRGLTPSRSAGMNRDALQTQWAEGGRRPGEVEASCVSSGRQAVLDGGIRVANQTCPARAARDPSRLAAACSPLETSPQLALPLSSAVPGSFGSAAGLQAALLL